MMEQEPQAKGRVVLRDSDTGAFYKHPGGWVPSALEATAFESHRVAMSERELIPNPKLEVVEVDSRGRFRFGVRLWKDGE